ncbi:Undecaprenyl phosphate-alpha-4-amino-4-deoxy-L-arabinose arabinosyl transferase [Pseudomonas syringae pv. helianthi]|uniref:Undecaprenyl phosphate-alpha-4-amino-4-deoxy-L-arabinose arabinosyl transferase n=1 Tax=Pseudomonas syringae pv. helianthi TaxID=251654 RepID=A0A0P9RUS6_9PSED|nr:lipid IV(A) 4-amino-4-deoxy-L-arabinosyltransferase [Pseudomonas syringae group genomosp. 7]KPX49941.1 Undecaprenyl phosphate-alpha-4-amino-4-deoxy-L-arabinose arabinosyl transferase [Pseudomonas syringae pv. helianthi]UNB65636.1 lipid IV(A) 4-amino-4-deoxy-L-arabinosyltransferase [Pseudomonas syringae pv. helianthi]
MHCRHRDCALLLLAFALAYLLPLGFHGLWIPDETRYAQISQEMLHSGNWIAPHFMGLRYFEKPAAGYWLIALGQAVFGENLFGVRIASALSTGLSILLAYLLAGKIWGDPRKSFASALLFMSFAFVAGQAGYSNLDPQFTLWTNATLVAFWYAVHNIGRARLIAWALVGVACGIGFMTKGFLAWALPVIITLPYMLWQRRLAELFRFGPLAVAIAVALCLPWALAVYRQEPDYWRYFFWHEHIRRFAGDNAQHAQPWWFYLPLLVAACLPWAALLPTTLKQAWQQKSRPETAFLLMWLVLPLAFLSLSKGKLPTYILPCLLPVALLMADALVECLNQGRGTALRVNGILNATVTFLGLLALIYLQLKQPVYQNEPMHLLLAVIVLVGWTLTSTLQGIRPLTFWAMPAVGSWLLIALLPTALPNEVVYNKTPDQFIARHHAELAACTHLLSNDLGAASALSWRLKRPEIALFNTWGELEYGLGYPDAQNRKVRLQDIDTWLANARSDGRVGVIMRGRSDEEQQELERLPKSSMRYEEGNLVILIYEKSTL